MANEYQVTLRGTINNQSVQHTRYYRAFNVPSTGDMQTLADELGSDFISAYASLFNPVITYQDMYIRPNIEGALGASFIPAAWPFAGSASGDVLPPYVTVNTRLRSGGITLPNKGLIQLPPPVEDAQVTGQLTTTALASYNTAAAMWEAVIVGDGGQDWTPLLYSDVANAYSVVTVTSVIQNLGTRDSRKYGRGK